jgi:GntR family transcriptional regulator, rspAB operon transcriptional repressor
MISKSLSAASSKETAKSAAKRVYLDLRQRIIDMTLLPGTRIIERDIAAEHSISRTPVHEAVQRLAEEGLIEVVQRVGTFVARIPLDQLEEAMLVRTALEGVVIEKAAERVKPEDIIRLKQILADQHACVEANDFKGFHRGDERFHEALADIAGLPSVWQMVQQTKTQVDRYRQLTLPLPGRMDGVVGQHQAVVDALESGQAHDAAVAMHEHLSLVLPIVQVAKSIRPEYFINHLDTAH